MTANSFLGVGVSLGILLLALFLLALAKRWRKGVEIPKMKKIEGKLLEKYITDLTSLGWFSITPTKYLEKAKENLKECLSHSFIDTTELSEDHPLVIYFEKKGIGHIGEFSLDLRLIADDPEDLTEGYIGRFLNKVNETFKLRGESLFRSCSDHIQESEYKYSVVVDEITYPIYSVHSDEELHWDLAIIAVVQIVDSLLEKKGDSNRLYFSWSGDNHIVFYLLTEDLYQYVTKNKLEGGFGKILKSI